MPIYGVPVYVYAVGETFEDAAEAVYSFMPWLDDPYDSESGWSLKGHKNFTNLFCDYPIESWNFGEANEKLLFKIHAKTLDPNYKID